MRLRQRSMCARIVFDDLASMPWSPMDLSHQMRQKRTSFNTFGFGIHFAECPIINVKRFCVTTTRPSVEKNKIVLQHFVRFRSHRSNGPLNRWEWKCRHLENLDTPISNLCESRKDQYCVQWFSRSFIWKMKDEFPVLLRMPLHHWDAILCYAPTPHCPVPVGHAEFDINRYRFLISLTKNQNLCQNSCAPRNLYFITSCITIDFGRRNYSAAHTLISHPSIRTYVPICNCNWFEFFVLLYRVCDVRIRNDRLMGGVACEFRLSSSGPPIRRLLQRSAVSLCDRLICAHLQTNAEQYMEQHQKCDESETKEREKNG